uniref:MAT homeobox alpha 2 protein n=1 Tax=Suhomyces bribrorum TaxID=246069 RepID=A0A3S9NLV0_9ASCO|nr:MAT homeobox alpha 2 protein [Suhomyces bribrorum]
MNLHTESLRQIELQLKMQITTICTFPVFDAEVMKSEIDAHASTIGRFLEDISTLSNDDILLLKSTSNLIKILHCMANERFNLQKTLFGLSEETDSNIISETTRASITPCKSKFSEEQTKKLEEWYESSLEHPYLNTLSTDYLHRSTGLTKTQIKNWVSNRRRKVKTKKISKELESFLIQE